MTSWLLSRAASPIHANMTEHPMFDRVPFAGTGGTWQSAMAEPMSWQRRKATATGVPVPMAAPAVGRHQQGRSAQIALRSHVFPRTAGGAPRQGGRVLIDTNIDPPIWRLFNTPSGCFPTSRVDASSTRTRSGVAVWTPFPSMPRFTTSVRCSYEGAGLQSFGGTNKTIGYDGGQEWVTRQPNGFASTIASTRSGEAIPDGVS